MARKAVPKHVEPEEESQEIPEEEPAIEEEDSDEPESGDKGMNKSQAARAAIDAGYEKPAQAVGYIQRQFGIAMNPQHFSAIKSNYKKAQGETTPAKATGEAAKRGPKPKSARQGVEGYVAPPPRPSDGGDLLETLEALKPLIAQHGADKLKRMVDLLG